MRMAKDGSPQLVRSAIFKSLFVLLIVAAIVFLSAGSWLYWQSILYCMLMFFMLALSVFCIADNPGLMNERMKPGKGTKVWDKVYWSIGTPLFFFTLSLAALDSGRFQLSPELPLYLYGIASVLYIVGSLLFAWAKKTNIFFSSVARIQADRGHIVCQAGPYQYVRHPGYIGTLLYTIATPLLFGSLWALIPTGIAVILMLIRTKLEDQMLESELAGYKEYQAKVRYRLIPHIW